MCKTIENTQTLFKNRCFTEKHFVYALAIDNPTVQASHNISKSRNYENKYHNK